MKAPDEKARIQEYIREHKLRKRWHKLTAVLAAVAVVVTAAVMILPAITMENEPEMLQCQLDLHTHTDSCYDAEGNLICGYADFVVHTHDESCYAEDGTLICPLEEIKPHTHDASCYEEVPELVCELEETEGHEHDESCYTLSQEPICGLEESVPHTHEGHIHTEECYTETQVLICGEEEASPHTHGPECYDENNNLICILSEEGHAHTDACYQAVKELTCTQDTGCYDDAGNLVCTLSEESHAHTEECYQSGGEPTCGQEEAPAHIHSEECYELHQELVCDKEEIILHTHTADCCDENGNLICGMLEVKEHVHDESCFPKKEQEENREEAADDLAEETASEEPPSTTFMLQAPTAVRSGVDFTHMITKISIQIQQNGYWVDLIEGKVEDGSPLRVRIEFTIPGGKLSDDNRTITYQLPDGVRLDKEETGEVDYNTGSPAGFYTIGTDGLITITFDEEFPVGQDFSGYLQFDGTATLVPGDDQTEINFGGTGGTITVIPEVKELDLTIAKTANYDKETEKVSYTITISSKNGTNDNLINVGDWFQHDVSYGFIKYDKDSLSIKKNGETEVDLSSIQISLHQQDNEKSWFKLTNLPALEAGESYTISYTATPDLKQSGDPNGYLEFTNIAAAYSGGKTVSANAKVIISQAMLEKRIADYNPYNRTVTWTIRVRNPNGLDLNGKQLEDWMTFTPSGATVPSFNQPPTNVTLTVQEYAATDVNFNTPVGDPVVYDDVTFPITFPAGSTGGYILTYTTTLPEELAGQTGYFNNGVKFEGYEANVGEWVEIPGVTNYAVVKQYWDKEEDVVMSNKKSVTALKWGTVVTYPQGATAKDVLFVDLIEDAKDQNGNVIPNSHYTTPEILSIGGLVVADSEGKIFLEPGTDFSLEVVFKDEQPPNITPENFASVPYETLKNLPWSTDPSDLTRPISMIAVQLTASGLEELDGQPFVVQYYTVMDTDEPTTEGTILTATNQARIPTAWDEASYEERFLKKIDKQVSSTGPNEETGDVSSYGDQPAGTFSPDGLIYYRILLSDFMADGTGGATVIDTLPAGAALQEGSVYLAGHDQAAQTINWNYLQQSPGYCITHKTAPGENGTTTITFTLSRLKDLPVDVLGIYYAVSVADDPVWDTGTSKDYTNTATWDNDTDSTTTTVSQTLPTLKKTGEQLYLDGTPSNQVRYYVVINPNGKKLLEGTDQTTLTLSDTLTVPDGSVAQLLMETAKVCHYDTSMEHGIGKPLKTNDYSIQYDGTTHLLTVEVPDETPCVVVYDYQIDRGGSEAVTLQVNNKAELKGVAATSGGFEIALKEQSSSAGVNTANFTLYKVNSENNAELLNKALFNLERFDKKEDGSGEYYWQQTSITAKGPDGYFITGGDGPDGKIILSFLAGENQTRYETIYRIKEVKAPDGFEIIEDKYYYFVWMKEGVSEEQTIANMGEMFSAAVEEGIDLPDVQFIPYNANHSLYVENSPTTTSITVEKTWESASGEALTADLPEQIEVTLYYQTAGGQKVEYPGTDEQPNPVTITPDADTGDWTHTWTGLPKKHADGSEYTYTVEETALSGFTASYTNNDGIKDGTIEITNTKTTSYVLPETGGMGPVVPAVTGLLLVGVSGMGIQYLRRRRRRGGKAT